MLCLISPLVEFSNTHSVLPHDTYGRDFGLFIKDHLPYVLGSNLTGIVQELGPGTTSYTIGQHIYGLGNCLGPLPDSNGLQEYALLETNTSAVVPDGFTDDQMVTLPINANTSFAALFHPNWLGFPPPFSTKARNFDYAAQSIVIIGAGSNCGKLAIQFAKIAGIGMIIAVASLSGEKLLRELGATHVVDRNSKSVVAEVKTICGGVHGREEVTHVYDCVNGSFELATEMVSNTKKSVITVLRPTQSAVEELKKRGKSKISTVCTVSGAKNNFDTETAKLFWDNLSKWVVEGKMSIPTFRIVEGLDVALVNEALDSYRKLNGAPQVVVHPNGNGNGK